MQEDRLLSQFVGCALLVVCPFAQCSSNRLIASKTGLVFVKCLKKTVDFGRPETAVGERIGKGMGVGGGGRVARVVPGVPEI